jgi:hypothetical protein
MLFQHLGRIKGGSQLYQKAVIVQIESFLSLKLMWAIHFDEYTVEPKSEGLWLYQCRL